MKRLVEQAAAEKALRRTFFLINPQSGKALDVAGGGHHNGCNILLWERHNGANQVWKIESDGSIRNPSSNKCLDV